MTEPEGSAHATLEGFGLHSGRACAVRLVQCPGPVVLAAEGRVVPLAELVVTRADHGVEVSLGVDGPRIDSVEHLLAALGGLGVRKDVRIEVNGGEIPLLDGGASAFGAALRSLGVLRHAPTLVVAREETIDVGTSRYVFQPGATTQISVEIAFDVEGIGTQAATWDGEPATFEAEIAWARTFGFRRDEAALLAAGRARGASADGVMILDDRGHVERGCAPARSAEHARHKLLDLVGDAALFGGPPRGTLHAFRPGHRATHAAIRTALERGALVDATDRQ